MSDWEVCHEHGATELTEDETRLACGCLPPASAIYTKDDA